MQREYPSSPLIGIGAVIIDEAGRVLLIRRAAEPLKGHWSLPGGLLELIELLDRIYREGERVRYHYVIADYLCRVKIGGGALQAASDADAARWAERAEWNSHSALSLDPITVRVIEAGWQRAQALKGHEE